MAAQKTPNGVEKRKRSKKRKSRTEVSSSSESESEVEVKKSKKKVVENDVTAKEKKKEKKEKKAKAAAPVSSSDVSMADTDSSPAPEPEDLKPQVNEEDFGPIYLRKITAELGDDLDKVREAPDFKASSLPMLIHALRQGEGIFSVEQKRRVVGAAGA